MLIEFTVKNFRSIKDEQVLSMVKAKGNELEATNSFIPSAPGGSELLRSSVIYGPNAAGKSNVIKAIMHMESIVLHSASASQEGDEIDVEPFIFDDISSSLPTEFEAIFISENVKYQYGFTATRSNIIEEWLIAYPKGRAQRWFSRIFDEKTKVSEFKFSEFLTGQKIIWQKATRNNALFLSTAVQLNSEQLKPVFNWFKESLRFLGSTSSTSKANFGFTALKCENEKFKSRIVDFMKKADFDIHDIQIEKETFDPNLLPEDIPSSLKDKIIQEMKGKDFIDVKTVHQTSSGKLVALDVDDESDGTKKFFSYAGPLLDTLENGYIFVIDELHNHLHPRMVRYLVDLFHSEKTNPNHAQLIFTTHETSILNQDVFRRDQVWFCEKDKEKATILYPLTDFSPKKDRENIEQGYLSGRYGAFPYVSSLMG